MGTLDYIFHSEHWSVNSADSLPSKELIMSKGASLPMEDEPSDHLMVSATLQLKQSNGSGSSST
jgi:mRNA deadenylase 3'-5' endonuclease subunit Ccr4